MSATIRALKSNRTALEAKPAAQVLCVWPSPGGPQQEGVFGTWGESEIWFVLYSYPRSPSCILKRDCMQTRAAWGPWLLSNQFTCSYQSILQPASGTGSSNTCLGSNFVFITFCDSICFQHTSCKAQAKQVLQEKIPPRLYGEFLGVRV